MTPQTFREVTNEEFPWRGVPARPNPSVFSREDLAQKYFFAGAWSLAAWQGAALWLQGDDPAWMRRDETASFCWLYFRRSGKGATTLAVDSSFSLISAILGLVSNTPPARGWAENLLNSNFGFGLIPILSEKVELCEEQIIM